MQSGLLWYDNSTLDMTAKILQAAARYQQKFGVKPDTCFVNPKDAPHVATVQGIHIKTKLTAMPNYFWLGINK